MIQAKVDAVADKICSLQLVLWHYTDCANVETPIPKSIEEARSQKYWITKYFRNRSLLVEKLYSTSSKMLLSERQGLSTPKAPRRCWFCERYS